MLRFGTAAGLPVHLPLFPDDKGEWCARAGFIGSIISFTEVLELTCHDNLGRSQIGEHVWRVTGARMLSSLDLPQPIIMLLARWGSQAILKYVADAPLSRLTEAYLEKVQAASTAVLGNLMDAPMPLAAAPTFSDEVDLVSSSAADLLTPPLAVDPSYRFAVNNSVGSQFVHIISSRQAWERPRPGRTNCGWDFLANQAPLFVSLPPLMRQCGKCASHPTWARFRN